jgi:prolyl oligopeptidase
VTLLRRGGESRVAIDPNMLSTDGTVAMDWSYPSPDGGLMAYGVSANGSEHSTLLVRDTRTGKDLTEKIPHTQFASVAWDPDGKGFLYTRHPEAGEVPKGEEVFHAQVFHHRLGDAAWGGKGDAMVFDGAGRPMQENRSVGTSSDERWVFLMTSLDWAKNDVWVRTAGTNETFRPVAVGLDGSTWPDAAGGVLYLRTNVDAPRYRIMTTDPTRPEPANWKVLVPEGPGVMEDFALAAGHLVVLSLENAVSRVEIYKRDGTRVREVRLPAMGTVSGLTAEPDRDEVYFEYTSFMFPTNVYRYDIAKDRLDPIEPIAAGPKPDDYVVKQEWATSKDGTRVPMFVVHRRDLTLDGERPTILTGYGGFEISETPAFVGSLLPWLEAGGVYVLANLRGGGEFGRAWHEAGRLDRKQNVFDDFYACAEWLARSGITRPDRIAARGGSNGGLLTGAALTQRPELFGAIVCQVPLLDMLRYQQFSMARYWVPEYGSSEDPKQLQFLKAYSPYQNVRENVRYPATLFTASESDARVAPLHARKMAALVQARTTGDAPILLRVESKAGHGAGKPVSKRVAESADILSFLMLQFGMQADRRVVVSP